MPDFTVHRSLSALAPTSIASGVQELSFSKFPGMNLLLDTDPDLDTLLIGGVRYTWPAFGRTQIRGRGPEPVVEKYTARCELGKSEVMTGQRRWPSPVGAFWPYPPEHESGMLSAWWSRW